jgi:hypothetical protein
MSDNKRFECIKGSRIIIDNETKLHYIMTLDWECSLVTKLLNRFVDENEQLKKEKESWKSSACNNSSFNSILLHELDIAQEQGYNLSNPFKKLMREKND